MRQRARISRRCLADPTNPTVNRIRIRYKSTDRQGSLTAMCLQLLLAFTDEVIEAAQCRSFAAR